jgi:hypothetical protein
MSSSTDGLTVDERYWLAGSNGLAVELQRLLVMDEDRHTRYYLAGNSSLAPELQHLLAVDENKSVRRHLARNSSLVPELQRVMAVDEDEEVRYYLAENKCVTLTSAFPVAFLELSQRGRDFITAHFAQAKLDPEDTAALREGWTGTFEELLETAAELSAAPA